MSKKFQGGIADPRAGKYAKALVELGNEIKQAEEAIIAPRKLRKVSQGERCGAAASKLLPVDPATVASAVPDPVTIEYCQAPATAYCDGRTCNDTPLCIEHHHVLGFLLARDEFDQDFEEYYQQMWLTPPRWRFVPQADSCPEHARLQGEKWARGE